MAFDYVVGIVADLYIADLRELLAQHACTVVAINQSCMVVQYRTVTT